MQEVAVKTHLIVSEVRDEYNIKWCGKIAEAKPFLQNGLPVFVLIGSEGRSELNTIDMKMIEETAKRMTHPRGKTAITKDIVNIYIKEENGNEMPLGLLTHKRIKKYQQMYDKVGFR